VHDAKSSENQGSFAARPTGNMGQRSATGYRGRLKETESK